MSDKDIMTKEPVEPGPKDGAKGDPKAEGGGLAPAAAGGGGNDAAT